MICHKYQCIFIHVPRTGGTSIERWLSGQDQWDQNSHTKHLIASQAKALYSKWWDTYFKFSFVRNPWTRVLSCLKYREHFGLRVKRFYRVFRPTIDFSAYHQRFGTSVVVEHDHRFYDRENLITPKHLPGQIYGNILDEDLDFIGTFENLASDCGYLKTILGVGDTMQAHAEKSTVPEKEKTLVYSPVVSKKIHRMYEHDIQRYGYRLAE